ncbi:hypothetical protein ACHAO7_011607, partial [Fusarium culmorum]
MDIDTFIADNSIGAEDIPVLLSELAMDAYNRHKKTQRIHDIDDAVEWAELGIKTADIGDPLLARWN